MASAAEKDPTASQYKASRGLVTIYKSMPVIPHATKKEQIASLYRAGITAVEELSTLTKASPSYVASVLRDAKLLGGYFDLYTSTQLPMNVYSRYFRGQLGFKNVTTARRSVQYLDTLFQQFGRIEDRAGQHHAMYLALTIHNRAYWSGKTAESKFFRDWLISQLQQMNQDTSTPSAAQIMHNRIKQRSA